MIKKEIKWDTKALNSSDDQDREDRYLSSEYSNGFVCNDSISAMEESHVSNSNDAFPLPLNPHFDLSALVMVSF